MEVLVFKERRKTENQVTNLLEQVREPINNPYLGPTLSDVVACASPA